ncbi:cation diffusion facilitator family transporter [Thiogranum longum]|uniref:Cation diffusion facilitator family transporter n=1 Tax=Thiogranum longum TaxID=1537524 RepID=A0A4R1H595_9GAMM|nr:cation diffusion facilitator family transporter [Thiogranum longum]TCK16884.1 cation diffusion facilitator family transporter [Thiogranum longum]
MSTTAEASVHNPRYREVRKVTVVGTVVDFVLGVAKIVIGWIAHSEALVADGVHSLSDLATDFVVLYAARHSHMDADEDHPYGHGRIETLATVGLGIMLILVSFGIAWDAVSRIGVPDLLFTPGALALVVAFLSVLSKEALYQYTVNVARRLKSNMLMANAWHHRSDAISSIVVFIGVAGAMMGYHYLDAVAAVVVAVMIAKIGLDLVLSSTRELIDTALEPELVEAISDVITHVNGVRALHMLRTRRSGGRALVDLHLQVDPRISVSEGHQIGDTVRRKLLEKFDEVTDVTVHIDPEDDETESPCDHLPLREELVERLRTQWSEMASIDSEDITLHYLSGKLQVDVALPFSVLDQYDDPVQLVQQIERSAKTIPEIEHVQVCFRA